MLRLASAEFGEHCSGISEAFIGKSRQRELGALNFQN